MSAPKVIWLKTVQGPFGKEIKRIKGSLVAVGEDWCTVEVDGQRFAAKTSDVKLAREASA